MKLIAPLAALALLSVAPTLAQAKKNKPARAPKSEPVEIIHSDFQRGELTKACDAAIAKAKSRLDEDDKELVASVQLAEGIWYSVMAYVGKWTMQSAVYMFNKRPSFQSKILVHATRSYRIP